MQDIKKILVLAVFIRILIIPFYYHPDIKTYHYQASFLKKGVFNIYSYLINHRESLPLKEEFVYFPLTYFFLGSYQIAAQPLLGPGFESWLSDASQSAGDRIGVFRYLTILKLPYLILDIITALVLAACFSDQARKKKALLLWLFNPFSIILIYVFSNIDIIPVFLSVLSYYLVIKKKMVLSALMLGLAASFKAYPILFLPFLVIAGRSLLQKVLIISASLGVFIASILPFISDPNFRQNTLASGLTTRIFQLNLSLGFNENIMIVILISGILLFYALQTSIKNEGIWQYFLSILLIIFAFIHFHIQWILWLIPYFVIMVSGSRKYWLAAASFLVLAFLIPSFYQDKFMTVGTLSVISPHYLQLPIPFSAASKFSDPYLVQSFLHSILAGGSIFLVWQLFRKEEL